MIDRLPPGSRVRKAAIARLARLALDAFNRRDLDAAMVGAHPDFEYHPNRDWVDAGLVEETYRGQEAYRRYVATVDEVWGGENYLTPDEVVDLGDRLVMLATGNMRAQASGVQLTEAFALVVTLKGGRAIRLQEYYDHGKALESVGLPAA